MKKTDVLAAKFWIAYAEYAQALLDENSAAFTEKSGKEIIRAAEAVCARVNSELHSELLDQEVKLD